MSVIRVVWREVAYKMALTGILKPKYVGEDRKVKAEKFAGVTFKGCYFVCASIYGFRLIQTADYAPAVLGGSGDTKNCWLDWENQPVTEQQKWYYLVSLAYHVQSLVFHCFQTRNDFLDGDMEDVYQHALVTQSLEAVVAARLFESCGPCTGPARQIKARGEKNCFVWQVAWCSTAGPNILAFLQIVFHETDNDEQ